MRLNEASFGGSAAVEGYGPGFFRAGGVVWQGPILIRPEGVSPWGGLEDAAPLLALAGQVDVLFLGLGSEVAHAPKALREALEAAGVGLEPMSSPAAARTYNVLLSEGRRIAAAMLPVTAVGA